LRRLSGQIHSHELAGYFQGPARAFRFRGGSPGSEERTVFTIPIASPAERFVPQSNAFALVHREGKDPAGVYFDTTGGSVFYTRTAGDSWQPLAEHLRPAYSVSTAMHP